MNILVTGSSGFIGRALGPALEARGHRVRGCGRQSLFDEESFGGSDAVVHLANVAHSSVSHTHLWAVNVNGTKRVAELAARCGVRRMIYVSSIKASGETTRDRPFDGCEESVPTDDYGRSKLAAEQALADTATSLRLEFLVLRPPLVYGPGVKANFLSLLHAIAHGWPLPFASLENRRSLMFVGNLVDAIGRLLEKGLTSRTYVISDDPPVSTPDLCRAIGAALGRPARLFPCPRRLLEVAPAMRRLTRSLEIDASALRSDLVWAPPFSFEEGLRATARWYQGR